MTFEQHLTQLAAHPQDRAQHAVFADWLLERGDARGEALAVELDGGPRARLQSLLKKHRREWLGPLAEHVDFERSEHYGPFPVRLAFKRGTPGEVLLQTPPTVRHLCGDWRALAALAAAKRSFEVLEVLVGLGLAFSDFRALAEELDALSPIGAPSLVLSIDAFAGVEAAQFLAAGLLRSALAQRERVTLVVRDGSLDAACAWLHQAPVWGGGDRWGAQWGGALVELTRDREGNFAHVEVDLSFDDEKAIAARAASAAAIMSQLRRLEPTRIEVRFREGQRVAKRLRDALEAPLRFLPSVGKVRVGRTIKKSSE